MEISLMTMKADAYDCDDDDDEWGFCLFEAHNFQAAAVRGLAKVSPWYSTVQYDPPFSEAFLSVEPCNDNNNNNKCLTANQAVEK